MIAELTSKKGAEINFVIPDEIEKSYLNDLATLKKALLENNMTYLGIVDNNSEVVFDAKDSFDTAKKIIVVANGDY